MKDEEMTDEKEPTREELWAEVEKERSADPVSAPETPAIESAPAAQTKQPAEVKPAEPAPPTDAERLSAALEEIEKLKTRQRNVEGHIGGLTSQQKALHETITAAKQAAAQVKDAPTDQQIAAAAKNPEEWDQLKEDFPQWHNATEKFVNAKIATIQAGANAEQVNELVNKQIQEQVGTITKELKAEIVDSAMSVVFPQWKEDINSPAFAEWAKAQPANIQALADSPRVGDAARMLSLFKEAAKANPVNQLIEQRKSKLENSVAAPRGGKAVLAKTPDQMTPAELWEYEARARERARAAA
jgi:hypothetical protein